MWEQLLVRASAKLSGIIAVPEMLPVNGLNSYGDGFGSSTLNVYLQVHERDWSRLVVCPASKES